jgi:phosphatidylethanolamine/phosphatidyl-N-methylethanolamine N-methyltransferase
MNLTPWPSAFNGERLGGSSARRRSDVSPMRLQSIARAEKRQLRFDDDVKFLRSWFEKPLATGAVMPSGRVLARTMARYVDPDSRGPVIELGPGTGPVTEALVRRGVDPARLVLVEFNPEFCRMLRSRYPTATVVQGDAYRLRHLLETFVREPAAVVVSGLPLVTKPLRTRLRLISDALALLAPKAPFVQFTYAMVPPIPKGYSGVHAEASELIWMNLPPARVWIYRGQ